jgi:hypothetical protein
MKSRIRMTVAATLLLGAGASHGFCVENGLPDRTTQAALALPKPQPPARIYDDTVAPGKESCCNPRNFECNPTRVPDAATLPFEARVDPPPGAPQQVKGLACGPALDPRAPRDPRDPRARRTIDLTARGVLRFEFNPQFDPSRLPDAANPPYLARVLTPERVLATTYPCSS